MKKLHLDAAALRVESFASTSVPPLRGTVRAAETWWESCHPDCPQTDWISCPATCGGTTCRPVDCP
jgi:hypothetical protein